MVASNYRYPSRRVVMHLGGDIDIANAPNLARTMMERIRRDGSVHVIADLETVTFFDCAGVRMLLQTQEFAESKGCVVTVRNAPPMVAQLFDILGLTSRLTRGIKDSHPARHLLS